MRIHLLLAGMIAASAATAPPAHSQTFCAPRDVVVERLTGGFGEGLAGGGLRSADQLLEVWAAPETGTWTVLITGADGQTCVLASGTDWHQQNPAMVLMGIPS